MLKFLLTVSLFVIGLGIFWSVISVVGTDQIAKLLLNFSPWGVMLLIVLTLTSQFIGFLKWAYILRAIGARVALWPLSKIGLVGFGVSYFTPIAYFGGEYFEGCMLKERHKVSWRKGISSIVIDKLSDAAVWASTIFAGIIIFVVKSNFTFKSEIIKTSLVAALSLGFVITLVYIFGFKRKSLIHLILKPLRLEASKAGQFLSQVEEEVFRFLSVKNKQNNVKILEFALCRYLILLVRNMIVLYYLTGVFSPAASTIALGFSQFSYTSPTPAAFGVQEGLLSLVFGGIGWGAGTGMALGLLVRGADMLVAGLGLFFFARWGLGRFLFKVSEWIKLNLSKQ